MHRPGTSEPNIKRGKASIADDLEFLPMSLPKMMRPLRSVLIICAVIGVGAGATWGFVRSHNELAAEAERERPIKAPLRVTIQDGVPVVRLDPETEQRNGIETTTLARGQHQKQVRAYGTVLDLARLTDLNNSYAAAKAQLQTAQAKIAASRAEADRSRTLYQSPGAIPLKQLQAAEATFGVDKAAAAAAESQVRTLTATANQEWGPVLGRSLVDGSAMVTRLIERRDLLVQVTLPPGASMSKPPETAVLQISTTAQAPVTYVSPATRTDPKIQGVSYFYMVSTDSGVLPGMNILAFLSFGAAVDGTLVPAASIVWLQGRAWIYRLTEPNTFTRIAISMEQSTPDGGYFVGGLPRNAQIVTRGAQSLLSEEFRAQLRVGEDQK